MRAGDLRNCLVGFHFADNGVCFNSVSLPDAHLRDVNSGDSFRHFRQLKFDGHGYMVFSFQFSDSNRHAENIVESRSLKTEN